MRQLPKNTKPDIELVMPAHNEEKNIAQVIKNLYDVSVKHNINILFIVCEDGSTDNTVSKLKQLSQTLPIFLISDQHRKGYSKAVVEGLAATTSEYVAFADSDGQYDPSDLINLYASRNEADIVAGYRHPRKDPLHRKVMSYLFKQIYNIYFQVPLIDPSCSFLVMNRNAISHVVCPNIGILEQGFWWEFYARAYSQHLTIKQIPVRHTSRKGSSTVVFRPTRIPMIAYKHILGLHKLRSDILSRPS